jgi:hypothetical protein
LKTKISTGERTEPADFGEVRTKGDWKMLDAVEKANIRPERDVAICPKCESSNPLLEEGIKRYSLFQYAMRNPEIEEVGVLCPTCYAPYMVPLQQFRPEVEDLMEIFDKYFWGSLIKIYRQWDLSVLVDLVLVEEETWRTLVRVNVSHWHIHPWNKHSVNFQWMESPQWKEKRENELVLTLTTKAKWLGLIYQKDPKTNFSYLGISARDEQKEFWIV